MNSFLQQFKNSGTNKEAIVGLVISLIVGIGSWFQLSSAEAIKTVIVSSNVVTINIIQHITVTAVVFYGISMFLTSRRKFVLRGLGFLLTALILILLAHTILQQYPPLNVTALIFVTVAFYFVYNAVVAINEEGKTNDTRRIASTD